MTSLKEHQPSFVDKEKLTFFIDIHYNDTPLEDNMKLQSEEK